MKQNKAVPKPMTLLKNTNGTEEDKGEGKGMRTDRFDTFEIFSSDRYESVCR
jgi:hypothetical protein